MTLEYKCTERNITPRARSIRLRNLTSYLSSVSSSSSNSTTIISDSEPVLMKGITVNATQVGHVQSGKIFMAGTSLESILRSILYKAQGAIMTSKISTGNVVEVGTSKGIITYETTRNDNGKMENAYFDNLDTNILNFSDEDVNGKQTANRELEGYYTQRETYNATVKFAASDDIVETILNNSIDVSVNRKWFGGVVSSLDGIDSDKVRALASNGFFTGEGSYKLYIPKGWKYLVLAIPTGYEVEKWYNSDMTYADFVQEKEYYGKTTASVYGANGQSAITYNIRTYKAAISGDEINSIFNIVKS